MYIRISHTTNTNYIGSINTSHGWGMIYFERIHYLKSKNLWTSHKKATLFLSTRLQV